MEKLNLEKTGPDKEHGEKAKEYKEKRYKMILEKAEKSEYWNKLLPGLDGWTVGDLIKTLADEEMLSLENIMPEKLYNSFIADMEKESESKNIKASEKYKTIEDIRSGQKESESKNIKASEKYKTIKDIRSGQNVVKSPFGKLDFGDEHFKGLWGDNSKEEIEKYKNKAKDFFVSLLKHDGHIEYEESESHELDGEKTDDLFDLLKVGDRHIPVPVFLDIISNIHADIEELKKKPNEVIERCKRADEKAILDSELINDQAKESAWWTLRASIIESNHEKYTKETDPRRRDKLMEQDISQISQEDVEEMAKKIIEAHIVYYKKDLDNMINDDERSYLPFIKQALRDRGIVIDINSINTSKFNN